jgi:hypothetical protein
MMVAGSTLLIALKDVGSMPSASAGLVRSKVRIGTERPTAELTPARSIRIVEKVTLWAIAKYQSSVGRHHHIRPSKVIALEQQRG